MQVRRYKGSVLGKLLGGVVLLAIGGGAGLWFGPKIAARLGLELSVKAPTTRPAESSEEGDYYYTCGMHPQVMQDKPGDCPICGMKLTRKKRGAASQQQPKKGPKERKILYWRAPMNPGFISDKPGKSPMGMDLVPVYSDQVEERSGTVIRIDPVTIQNMGIRTTKVRRGPVVRTIRTLGHLDYDERLVGYITTKFSGWLEKLYIDYTGQPVRKGDPLFDVYSPELYQAQTEFIQALKYLPTLEKSTFQPARGDAVSLVESARTKLAYFDISPEQIEELAKSRKVQKTMTIYSPFDGIVTEKMALEGMYVKPGMRLYTIVDLSRIWVYVSIYEYQLPFVRLGQEATMELSYIPGKTFQGRVVYIYPYLSKKTRDVKVRLEFENPTLELKPEMYANVRLEAKLKDDALLVPREAFIDSGEQQIAFVDRGEGKFAPRKLDVGAESENGMVEVLAGLAEGETVVVSGQFLLDSESKLKEAVAKMMEARKTAKTAKQPAEKAPTTMAAGMKREPAAATRPTTRPATAAGATSRPTEAKAIPADAKYGCVMPEDWYFSDKPGECPKCGMKLKPLDEIDWVKQYGAGAATTRPVGRGSGPHGLTSRGATEAHRQHESATQPAVPKTIPPEAKYGCVMPEDWYFSDKPGRCPKCGMKLKPLDQIDWVQAIKAAEGAQVAYTCPDHPAVFSTKPDKCPYDGKDLEPFKVLYTCGKKEHAGHISLAPGRCPECGDPMFPFRGPWLSQKMAAANRPPTTQPVAAARYRCPVHPLVHSDKPGQCTICARPLEQNPGARMAATTRPAGVEAKYACPMHPDQVSDRPGTCPICAMRLVAAAKANLAASAKGRWAVNHITEHYLALRALLASDTSRDIAPNALGLADAANTLSEEYRGDPKSLASVRDAAKRMRAAALKMTGKDLQGDRASFAAASNAFLALLKQVRPDRHSYPKLYIFYCPMAKAPWVQQSPEIGNPYYGFEMLKCGELREEK